MRAEGARRHFDVRIVSALNGAFECGNGVPVRSAATIADDPDARIVIVPELWLDPDEDVHGRYPARRHRADHGP